MLEQMLEQIIIAALAALLSSMLGFGVLIFIYYILPFIS